MIAFESVQMILFWTQLLAGLACLLQTLEYLALRSYWSNSGPWSAKNLSAEYGRFRALARIGFSQHVLELMIAARFAASIFLLGSFLAPQIVTSLSLAALALSTLYIAVRFRGSFNGGSDSMTFHVLLSCLVASLWPHLALTSVHYITALVVLSYFVGGIVKLRSANWRSGLALKAIFEHSQARHAGLLSLRPLSANSYLLISWLIIGWECLFPAALLNSSLLWFFLISGGVFHFANFLVFGLNRFFWIWLAAYLAVYLSATLRNGNW